MNSFLIFAWGVPFAILAIIALLLGKFLPRDRKKAAMKQLGWGAVCASMIVIGFYNLVPYMPAKDGGWFLLGAYMLVTGGFIALVSALLTVIIGQLRMKRKAS